MDVAFSSHRLVKSRLPQDSVLGPLLFLFFFRFVICCMRSLQRKLYMLTALTIFGPTTSSSQRASLAKNLQQSVTKMNGVKDGVRKEIKHSLVISRSRTLEQNPEILILITVL